MTRERIFEKVFEELVDNDLLDLHNYEYDSAKKRVMEILENKLKDYHIIKGDLL